VRIPGDSFAFVDDEFVVDIMNSTLGVRLSSFIIWHRERSLESRDMFNDSFGSLSTFLIVFLSQVLTYSSLKTFLS
jgi:hypothetical protein